MSSFPKLNEHLILFSLRYLFYMKLDSTATYSSFDTLFFLPLIIPCPSPTWSLTRSTTDHNEPNKKHYCDISLCLQGLAWLWHVAIVKLEGCWRNTVKKTPIWFNSDSCGIKWRSQIAARLSHDPSLVDSGWPSLPSVLYILSNPRTQREWK